MDSQNENQNTESTQQNDRWTTQPKVSIIPQEKATMLAELQQEYDDLEKKLEAYYKKVSEIKFKTLDEFEKKFDETKEEGDKLVEDKEAAAAILYNYKTVLDIVYNNK